MGGGGWPDIPEDIVFTYTPLPRKLHRFSWTYIGATYRPRGLRGRVKDGNGGKDLSARWCSKIHSLPPPVWPAACPNAPQIAPSTTLPVTAWQPLMIALGLQPFNLKVAKCMIAPQLLQDLMLRACCEIYIILVNPFGLGCRAPCVDVLPKGEKYCSMPTSSLSEQCSVLCYKNDWTCCLKDFIQSGGSVNTNSIF